MEGLIARIGFYSLTGATFALALWLTVTWYKHVWDYSRKEMEVTFGSYLLAIVEQGKWVLKAALKYAVILAFTLLVGIGVLYTGAGWQLAAGYAVITAAIAGLIFPRLMRRMAPKREKVAEHAVKESENT